MKKYLWLFNIIMIRYLIYICFSLSISIFYYFVFNNLYIAVGLFIFVSISLILFFELGLKNIDINKNKEIEMYDFILKYHDLVIIKKEKIKENKIYSSKLKELIKNNKDTNNLKDFSSYFSSTCYEEFLKELNSTTLTIFIKNIAFKYEFLLDNWNKKKIAFKRNIFMFFIRESIFYTTFMVIYFSIFILKKDFIDSNIFKIVSIIPIIITFVDSMFISISSLFKRKGRKND